VSKPAAWITPAEIPADFFCRVVHIPKSVFIQAAIFGALLPLVSADNWELTGDVTPDEIAAAMLTMFEDLSSQDGVCLPVKPILLQDRKTAGTAGGGFTNGAWQTRTLNTELYDDDGFVSLSGNVFTLQPGTWLIEASAPAYRVAQHQTRLFDVSNTVFVENSEGTSEIANSSDSTQTRSFMRVIQTITQPKDYRLEHRCVTTQATNGLGFALGQIVEVYAEVLLTKLS